MTRQVRLSLAIVACGPQLELALGGDGFGPASVVRLSGPTPRSTLVLAAVDLLVEDSGLSSGDIAVVGVTRGPGSFTGIRSGLATAHGLTMALEADVVAYDSLLVQAGRVRDRDGTVWAAQPGRRGQVYAQRFTVSAERAPTAVGDVVVLDVERAAAHGPWVAAERTDLGTATRIPAGCSAAESVLHLLRAGVASEEVAPKYVEGPPIHRPGGA